MKATFETLRVFRMYSTTVPSFVLVALGVGQYVGITRWAWAVQRGHDLDLLVGIHVARVFHPGPRRPARAREVHHEDVVTGPCERVGPSVRGVLEIEAGQYRDASAVQHEDRLAVRGGTGRRAVTFAHEEFDLLVLGGGNGRLVLDPVIGRDDSHKVIPLLAQATGRRYDHRPLSSLPMRGPHRTPTVRATVADVVPLKAQ